MKIIGIDPAFRSNGFWICEIYPQTNTVAFSCMKEFIHFIQYIEEQDKENTITVIENSNLQNVTFLSSTKKNVAAKLSRNAGMNQAISQITVDICKHFINPNNVIEISPAQKGQKWDNQTTTSVAKSLKHTLTNYKGLKSEQDKRDAYKLALIALNKL